MADQVLQSLVDQRLMAATEFLKFIPQGNYYEYGGAAYVVSGSDKTNGWIDLTSVTNPGNTIHIDPLAEVFPNASADPSAAASLTPAAANPNGFNISSAAGLGGTAAQIWQTSKLGKNPAGGTASGGNVLGSGGPSYSAFGSQSGGSVSQQQNVQTLQSKLQNADVSIQNINGQNPQYASYDNVKAYQDAFSDSWTKNVFNPLNESLTSATAARDTADGVMKGLIEEGVSPTSPAYITQVGNYNSAQRAINTIQGKIDNLDLTGTLNQKTAEYQTYLDKYNAAVDNYNGINEQVNSAEKLKTTVDTYNTTVGNALSTTVTPPGVGETSLAALELQKNNVHLTYSDGSIVTDPANVEVSNLSKSSLQQLTNQIQTDRTNNLLPQLTLTQDDLSAAHDQLLKQYNTAYIGDPDYDPDYQPSPEEIQAFAAQTKMAAISSTVQDYQGVTTGDKFYQLQQQMLKGAEIKFGIELAAAAGAGYAEENAIEEMARNGYSFKELATSLGSAAGMYISLKMANTLLSKGGVLLTTIQGLPGIGKALGSGLSFLTSTWGSVSLIGAIALVGLLKGLFSSSTPPEETAAENLNTEVNPVVWNPNGQVIFLTAGLTMASMGINMSPSAPMMQSMMLPQAQLTQALQNAGASSVPTDNTRYADVFVQQGTNGQATQVVYLTPSGTDARGNIIETATVVKLNSNYQFASQQPPTGYVPFFIPGGANGSYKVNSQVLMAQQHLLQCANGAWVVDAQLCTDGAASTSHP